MNTNEMIANAEQLLRNGNLSRWERSVFTEKLALWKSVEVNRHNRACDRFLMTHVIFSYFALAFHLLPNITSVFVYAFVLPLAIYLIIRVLLATVSIIPDIWNFYRGY